MELKLNRRKNEGVDHLYIAKNPLQFHATHSGSEMNS